MSTDENLFLLLSSNWFFAHRQLDDGIEELLFVSDYLNYFLLYQDAQISE